MKDNPKLEKTIIEEVEYLIRMCRRHDIKFIDMVNKATANIRRIDERKED